jgi:signal peptide peptidase SppA
MKFQHILQKAYHEPWLITPGAHASIVALIETRILDAGPRAEREGTDYCGEKVELAQMEVIDGIAHIPIGGVIGRKLTSFEKGAGAVDVLDIEKEIKQAEEDPRVRGIILDIDSPGGMVSGTPELAERISQVEKPIFAYTEGLIASAAYWIASACDQVFATRSAEIGSIGVYIPWVDATERYKAAGLSVKVIKSGRYKGMGYPGTPLSDDQQKLLQDRVNKIAEEFYQQVRGARGDVSSETMQGQTFDGNESLSRLLIDGVVKSKDDVVQML